MKRMLLHACCAPCSSGVVPQIDKDYDITLLFYNPNIDTLDEYNLRLRTLEKYVALYNSEFNKDIKLIAIPYDHSEFLSTVKGLENEVEGGNRCKSCIDLRLTFTAKYAKENNYDIFASTLSVSPHKNHIIINNIGNALSLKFDIPYLENNFKKNDGYLNSIRQSQHFDLYRQNYCGCEFARQKSSN